MRTITKYTRKDGKVLKIKENSKGDYIGEVYDNAKAKTWSQRATFESKYRDNTEYRVKEYFGFAEFIEKL